jgi:hypothetical protein
MLQKYHKLPNCKFSYRDKLSECSGIYFAIARDTVLYVGQAKNLRNRWQNHHRSHQLEEVHKKYEVKLFWLECPEDQLNALESEYIDYYCPTLNQTKVPDKPIIPSFEMLTLSLKKLQEKVIVMGICPGDSKIRLKMIILYLSAYSEIRRRSNNIRTIIKKINKHPKSLLRWSEVDRSKYWPRWRTKCNGIEIWLIPGYSYSAERIMHNPSMHEVMLEKRFGKVGGIPVNEEYYALKDEVKEIPFAQRLELARSTERGWQLFPLECGAEFRLVSGVKVLCLTDSQLEMIFSKFPYLQERYPGMSAINDDPLANLMF